jgi:predicted transcriptional regulator
LSTDDPFGEVEGFLKNLPPLPRWDDSDAADLIDLIEAMLQGVKMSCRPEESACVPQTRSRLANYNPSLVDEFDRRLKAISNAYSDWQNPDELMGPDEFEEIRQEFEVQAKAMILWLANPAQPDLRTILQATQPQPDDLDDRRNPPAFVPDDDDLKILRAGLKTAKLILDLAEGADCNRDTVSERLPPLVTAGLMATKKVRIRLKYYTTPAGKELLDSIDKDQT